MKIRLYQPWIILSGILIVAGCAAPTTKPQATLYDRLGGKPAITAVVSDFIDLVGQDARVLHSPAPARVPVIKTLLVEMVCQASGGPCTYSGRDMKKTHAGMGISNAEFEAVVDDLVKTLNQYKVPEMEKNDLLALLAPMRKDIVETP
ncbi:MAG: group 1 truncated hemoglobin [Nitrospirae bacterium]|nr:group 1 truncated hemoglobin [Nitrospirota bacterium]